MKRTTFAAACVLCPALLLAACAPQGAASASAFGDRPPMDESISASSADALPAEDGSILLAEAEDSRQCFLFWAEVLEFSVQAGLIFRIQFQ